MNDKLKKVQDDDLSIIELDNRCDMSIIDPTLSLVLFDGTTNQFGCNSCNNVSGC
jgi:hypothetical protein